MTTLYMTPNRHYNYNEIGLEYNDISVIDKFNFDEHEHTVSVSWEN